MTDNINTGEILEALNDKVDRDCRNVDTTSGADVVIESKFRQNGDNATWYRLYKSGWIEQGGYFSLSDSSYATITLEKEMANKLYHINATYYDNLGTDTTVRGCNTSNKETTSFSAKVGTSGNDKFISWEVKGMSAQS